MRPRERTSSVVAISIRPVAMVEALTGSSGARSDYSGGCGSQHCKWESARCGGWLEFAANKQKILMIPAQVQVFGGCVQKRSLFACCEPARSAPTLSARARVDSSGPLSAHRVAESVSADAGDAFYALQPCRVQQRPGGASSHRTPLRCSHADAIPHGSTRL